MKVLFVIASFCFFMYCISESLEEARKICENKQGYEFTKPVGRNQPWQCMKIEVVERLRSLGVDTNWY